MKFHRNLSIRGVMLGCVLFILIGSCGLQQAGFFKPSIATTAAPEFHHQAATNSEKIAHPTGMDRKSVDFHISLPSEVGAQASQLSSDGSEIDRQIELIRSTDSNHRIDP
jgi:hypothetical protein